MAGYKKNNNYYLRKQESSASSGEVFQNVVEAMKEWQVTAPREVSAEEVTNYGVTAAPTSSEKTGRNPRARAIGYNNVSRTLIVVFWDNTWWQYNDVGPEIWLGLSSSPSTGGYLHSSGLNTWSSMGNADLDAIPAPVRAQIASTAMTSGRIYGK